ncbi:MAG: MFS transporter [Dehalococcoidia bacterium]|nr:MFS transporter [Dehalococcoidia bacterium]
MTTPDTAPTAPATPPSNEKAWRRAFQSLAVRDYRLLWLGQASTSMGQWMDQVCRGWLIYELTGSPLLLGAVTATRAVPMVLFGIAAGVVADRFGRKGQLLVAQAGNAFIELMLGVLVLTQQIEVWHVFAAAFAAGTLQAFQQPARQALISDLVGERLIVNAIALNSAVLNMSRSVGPAIAGLLIAQVSVGGAYLVQSLLYASATLWTMQMRVPETREQARQRRELQLWAGLREGFRYIADHREIKIVLLLALAPLMLAQPYTSLLPVFAKEELDVGPEGLGMLFSAPGIGAVIGAFGVATFGRVGRRGTLMLAGAAAFGLSILGISMAPWLSVALPLLAVSGFANTSYNAFANSFLQTATPPQLRGRVMSIYLLDRGLVPLGTLLAGTLATVFDARVAMGLMGASCALLVVAVALLAPSVRRIA